VGGRRLASGGEGQAAGVGGAQPSWTRADLPAELDAAVEAVIAKQGRAPVILRVTELAGYTDWVLIASGRSDRHVAAVVEEIQRRLRDRGMRPRGTDGLDQNLWALLDYEDFIVHVFYHPVRLHYDLESMWSDAPRVSIDVPRELADTTDLDSLALPDALPEYRGDAGFGGWVDEFEDDELGDEHEDEDEDDRGGEEDDEPIEDDEPMGDTAVDRDEASPAGGRRRPS
jgi:ribosome-associated protein